MPYKASITAQKGVKGFIQWGISALITSGALVLLGDYIVLNNPEIASYALIGGTITIGAIWTAIANWLKHRKDE